MYKINDEFKTNYDQSTWKIISYTYVMGDNNMQLKPGYIISATTYNDNFSISH